MTQGTKDKKNRFAGRIKTGAKHQVRAPLPPPDAFRTAHWLAAMAFLRTETRHTQRTWSWIEAKWHEFSKYTFKHEKTKMIGSGAFSLGTSVTASLTAWGITTVVGGVIGTLGGPLGTILGILAGAGIGAGVGMATAVVSFTAGLIANRAQYKASRKDIFDRLTKSNYDYREDFKKRFETDPEDKKGHWFIITKKNETLEKIARRYEKGGVKFSDLWSHKRNKEIRKYCRKKSPGRVARAQVVLKKKQKVWIPVAPGPDYLKPGMSAEIYNLTYLVKHSFRDSLVHLRRALAIHREMVEDGGALTGGVDYVPGENETIEKVITNARKLHPKLKFTKTDILTHPKNGPESEWYDTGQSETLADICTATGAKWYNIVDHPSNSALRDLYVNAGQNPVNEITRRSVFIDSIDQIYIPGRLPEVDRESRVEIHEYNGKLHQVRNGKTLYVQPGKPIWIPSARLSDRDQPFRDCDQMTAACEPAMEFTHELNKARNYTLPCLNLCRMYLDVFEEMSQYREMAQQEIEAAVLDYAKRGNHKKCFLIPEFYHLEADYRRAFSGTNWHSPLTHWFKEITSLPKKRPVYKCIRTPLKRLKKKGGALETYTVSGDNETFESIAKAKGITAQALAAHNHKRHQLAEDQVKLDKKSGKLKITKAALPSGVTLEIPPTNRMDKLLYHWIWEKIGIGLLGPKDEAKKLSATYQDKVFAQVTIAEVDTGELRKDLDAIINEYYKALEKNREYHQSNFDKASPDQRRYFIFCGDVLHRYDMPGLKNRIQHRLDHIWNRSTRQEKTAFTIKSILDILVFAPISGAVGGGKKAIFKAVEIPTGSTALMALAVNPLLASMAQPVMDTKLDANNILIREGVDKGWSITSALTKTLTQETIIPKLINKSYDGSRKERLTGTHALDFRRERIALSALGQRRDKLKDEERALKEAAKITDELFVKISRHFMNAWDRWFNKVFPRVDKLMDNHDKIGYGLTGCRDSYQHLKHLFEFRHALDKAERYLLGALSLALRLREWEAYLAGVEKEVWETVDKAAGKWITEGDHNRCHKKKVIGHRHCYGPHPDDDAKPARPFRDRPEMD